MLVQISLFIKSMDEDSFFKDNHLETVDSSHPALLFQGALLLIFIWYGMVWYFIQSVHIIIHTDNFVTSSNIDNIQNIYNDNCDFC